MLQHEGLPPEVALLLPNQDTNRLMMDALARPDPVIVNVGIGFFMADPFLNLDRIVGALRQAGIQWVANLPSVEQQDAVFTRQLTDIGLDHDRELSRLAALRGQGFRIAVSLSDADTAPAALAIDPDALIVLPRVADYAAGFPSFRQRGTVAQSIRQAAQAAGWTGPILGLGEASEVPHQTLWPEPVDGLICRPAMVGQPASPYF